MKEKCDNKCETCPMQTQMHCVLLFSKATNASVGMLTDRMMVIESKLQQEQPMLLTPQYSVKHPTLEEDETVKEEEL